VGYSGIILNSRNGRRWVVRHSGTEEKLLGIAFGRGLFVSVGRHGVILTSEDGTHWTFQDSKTSHHLRRIFYIPGVQRVKEFVRDDEMFILPVDQATVPRIE
jgi:hypothetical protein